MLVGQPFRSAMSMLDDQIADERLCAEYKRREEQFGNERTLSFFQSWLQERGLNGRYPMLERLLKEKDAQAQSLNDFFLNLFS